MLLAAARGGQLILAVFAALRFVCVPGTALEASDGLRPRRRRVRVGRAFEARLVKRPESVITAVLNPPLFRVFEVSTHLLGCAVRFFLRGATSREHSMPAAWVVSSFWARHRPAR